MHREESSLKEGEKDRQLNDQDQYYELFKQAPIAMFRTTSDNKILSINSEMAEILGAAAPEMVLDYYNDLENDLYVDPNKREDFIKKLVKNSKVKNFDFKAKKIDESIIWLKLNARIIEEKKNGTFIIEGYVFDISEEKNNEKKLREQKRELAESNQQLTAYNEEIRAMNEELEQSFEELNTLNQRFVNMINLVSDIEDKTFLTEKEFFSDLLKNAIDIVPEADYGKICIVKQNGKCRVIDSVGHDIDILKKLEIDKELLLNNKGSGVFVTKDYPIKINKFNAEDKKLFLKALKATKESLYINIIVAGQFVGRISLEIKAGSSSRFSDTTKNVLKSFSTIASSYFAFKRFEKLQSNFTKELITSIIKIMEMYDLYTKGHSENVAELASAIAKKMNLSAKTIRNTYWAGLVHDIGKLLIPLDIINKTEKLTEAEFALIKKHPSWGKIALSNSDSLQEISDFILHHHERWDGKGYPDNLRENEIPLISQILAVADSWDAMLSNRAYRSSLSREKALDEIINNKGKQFSPVVAEAFIDLIKNKELETIKKDVLINEINLNDSISASMTDRGYFEELFEESEEGIVILDSDFDIIRANKYFLEMFEFETMDIIGKNIREIVPDSKTEETNGYIDDLIRGEKISSNSYRQKKDGEIVEVSVQAFPISLSNKNGGYYVIYRDISELETAKRKYTNIKERYRALFENESTVMLIIDPDSGDIIEANPAAVNFYGWSKEELSAMKITDINTMSKEEVKAEMTRAKSKDKLYFNFKHKTSTGEVKAVEVYSQPIPFVEKDYLYSIIHEAK